MYFDSYYFKTDSLRHMYAPHVEIVTEYIANSMSLVVLSVEIFSTLFLVGLVNNIVIVLLIEGVILTILLFRRTRI